MDICLKLYKSKPVQFKTVSGGVEKRRESIIRERKSKRFCNFDKGRTLPKCENPAPKSEAQKKLDHNRLQLQKWKEERNRKKQEAALQKTRPFLAGSVRNPLNCIFPSPLKPKPGTSRMITRSQSAKNNLIDKVKKSSKSVEKPKSLVPSFAPKDAVFHPTVLNIIKVSVNADAEENPKETKTKTKDTAPNRSKTRTLRSRQQTDKGQVSKKPSKAPTSKQSGSHSSSRVDSNNDKPKVNEITNPTKLIQSKQSVVTSKNMPESESSSEEKLRSAKLTEVPKTLEKIADEASEMSPCVTLSRGKDNARKEIKKKINEGLLDEDLCEMDSVKHFRRQLDSEIARMTEMCEAWNKISQQIVLPETVQEEVRSSVGQARLLMSQKMQQFASLLSCCEHPTPSSELVTPTDLHGFWDLIYIQIENVDIRFRKLEELCARGWSEQQEPLAAQRPSVQTARPASPARPARPARPASSRLKDIIAAARRAKQEQPSDEETNTGACSRMKTIDMGFFSIQSPVKTPVQAAPSTPSLLKTVLSNEAEKLSNRESASFAMLRTSLIGRQMGRVDSTDNEIDLITFSPVQLGQTPGRGILKNKVYKKLVKKSIKTVIFNDSDLDNGNTGSINADKTEGSQDKTECDNVDSGISSMDIENELEEKNKTWRKSRLTRQDATEGECTVMTRSRRKMIQTPTVCIEVLEKRSGRKKKTPKGVNGAEEEQETPNRIPGKSTNRKGV